MQDFSTSRINPLPKPECVFRYFTDICSIPHGSGNTKAISDYCVNFALKHKLKYFRDSHNNVVIFKNAFPGCESAPTVIIQGHLDMVCEKAPDCSFDFEKSGLILKTDGDFMYAQNTTLGADDGIAIAYALAVLSDDSIVHPPIEAVFTTDEETGMTGASALDCSALRGRIMLNIDSEDEGIFTVSCAGGSTVCQNLPVTYEMKHGFGITVKISGLTGGHSGVEIHHGRGNAICLLGRLLHTLNENYSFSISDFHGGMMDNAIPVEAVCKIVVSPENLSQITNRIFEVENELKKEFLHTDPKLNFTVDNNGPVSENVLTKSSLQAITRLINDNPNGVRSMNPNIDGLVQTSVNTGIARLNSSSINLHLSVRSSSSAELSQTADKIASICRKEGGTAELTGSYPPWEFNPESKITDICTRVYKKLYGNEPVVTAIHAGLECGIFAGKLDGLDCISFGPNIEDIHTYRERISIESVQRVWDFIINILSELAALH